MEWSNVLESLIASGPLGGASAFVAYKLWVRDQERTKEMAAMQAAHATRIDQLQTAHAATLEKIQEARIREWRELVESTR